MADHRQIVPFFIKWEGGLSNDKSDSASSNPCPLTIDGIGGYHTNKGVTYSAWVGVFGKNQNERFVEMNEHDWGLIFKSKYWDAVKGDDIESQAIANVLVSWAWGSGAKTAVRQIQRVVGVTRDGIIGKNTLKAINERNELELFDECIKQRESFFRYICERTPRNKRFLKGWLNRLEDFNNKFRPDEK
jgi:lysozyme family protein